MSSNANRWISTGLACLLACGIAAGGPQLDTETLERVEATYGPSARARVEAWDALMKDSAGLTLREKLERVNGFFNRLAFVDDEQLWGQPDHWATPIEFLGKAAGDCEDFSLAKYFTLRELGVPDDQLRLVYVKSVKLDQAHMVLAWYEQPAAEPLILDNLVQDIRRAALRKDLVPVYSFNGEGLWLAKTRGEGKRVGGADRLSRWNDLVRRMNELNSAADGGDRDKTRDAGAKP